MKQIVDNNSEFLIMWMGKVAQFKVLQEFLLGEPRETTEALSKFFWFPEIASKPPPSVYRSEEIRVVPGCSFLTTSRRQTSEIAEFYIGLDLFYCHSWPATTITVVRHSRESKSVYWMRMVTVSMEQTA
jgi:hypothetical protein